MNVCACLHVRVCVRASIHVCIRACVHACVNVHLYDIVCMVACECTCMHACTCTSVHVCVHACMHVYPSVHVCLQMVGGHACVHTVCVRESEPVTSSSEWDCVASCFFIDTAHNVIDYLERIHTILKPGGFWINFGDSSILVTASAIVILSLPPSLPLSLPPSFPPSLPPSLPPPPPPRAGPLLYHFADSPGEPSVELSWEDIRRIAEEEIGFEILVRMLGLYYVCVLISGVSKQEGARQGGGGGGEGGGYIRIIIATTV